jgi:phenylacetic acid degradation operon negative regulatory protein
MAAVEPLARSASERQALRSAMEHLRYGEVRAGLWVRPDNLPDDANPPEARAIADAQCGWWVGRPEIDPLVLTERLFAPTAWATRADELGRRLGAVTERLGAGDASLEADAFLTGAATLVHVRADPLLPEALLPPDWPGTALRAAYDNYRGSFGDATARWFRRNRD